MFFMNKIKIKNFNFDSMEKYHIRELQLSTQIKVRYFVTRKELTMSRHSIGQSYSLFLIVGNPLLMARQK